MHITAAELPDRLRQMARNGLTETASGRRAIPPDGAASVAEFAADIVELRDKKIAILTNMLRAANEIIAGLADGIIELASDNQTIVDRCKRARDAAQKTNLALADLQARQQ